MEPRRIKTSKLAISSMKNHMRNALACDMALGCSSNSVLHLLAIANEAGVELNLDIFNEFSAKVPNLCHLAPAGGTHMHDLNNAGGLRWQSSASWTKKGLIDESLITATGKTGRREHQGRIRQELRYHQTCRQAVQRDRRHRYHVGKYRTGRLCRKEKRRCS